MMEVIFKNPHDGNVTAHDTHTVYIQYQSIINKSVFLYIIYILKCIYACDDKCKFSATITPGFIVK